MSPDILRRLQSWYASQCNGAWEHSYGITIDTLDNPGWSFKVDLAETALFDRTFAEVSMDGVDPHDWYSCRLRGHVFEAYCGPTRLNDVITIFVNWADSL